ncbi:SAP domain-containing protein [Sediminibacillus albus]|uniref:SAP domain-containing protein n=1 Tax=Sediminibacillus albus TaxID=407036 RepID=A0A1G8WNB4_9BACI|nr:SAP domain-containing protein [Sediminibacillus albus]SDJ79587.1 SAP domain-containing protein [Sediminibacillus albus]
MQMQDVLPKMSKLYLSRIVDSFLKDVRLNNEEEMREVIMKNIDEFQNSERVKRNLNFLETDRDIALVNEMILMALMENEGYVLPESELFTSVENLEQQIVEESKDDDFIKTSIPEDALRIYTAVLMAAWKKDESLNSHEINMLAVLKNELGLSTRDHYLIESIAGRFPQRGNKLHSIRQIEKSLKDLQSRGIILRFKTDEAYYIIPKEIARVVRYELGGELRKETYLSLLNDLNVNQLKNILSPLGLNVSGTKSTLIERIIRHNILPTKALNFFSSSELTDVLRTLDGAKISGTKEEKIKSIIDYYENLTSIENSDPTDSRSRLYDFYEDLAARNYKPLRVNKIIDKDLDIERSFEEATKYIFEKKLNINLVEMPGSKHADGKMNYNPKEVILWDNKSVESPYNFPDSHFEQFLGYIKSEGMRVTLFLIITSDYTNEAISKAQKLKAFSEEDTDVAIISADDLKYVAEEWQKFSGQKEPKFNLQVFNLTGELTRTVLASRMEWAIQ